jgi:multidrug efflux pump
MIAGTLLGIFFTPLFFVVVQRLFGRRKPGARTDTEGSGID